MKLNVLLGQRLETGCWVITSKAMVYKAAVHYLERDQNGILQQLVLFRWIASFSPEILGLTNDPDDNAPPNSEADCSVLHGNGCRKGLWSSIVSDIAAHYQSHTTLGF